MSVPVKHVYVISTLTVQIQMVRLCVLVMWDSQEMGSSAVRGSMANVNDSAYS